MPVTLSSFLRLTPRVLVNVGNDLAGYSIPVYIVGMTGNYIINSSAGYQIPFTIVGETGEVISNTIYSPSGNYQIPFTIVGETGEVISNTIYSAGGDYQIPVTIEGSTDSFEQNVSLQFEGNFSDDYNHIFANEGVVLSTSRAQGTSSAYFSRTSNAKLSSTSTSYSIGTGNFTVEFFVKFLGNTGANEYHTMFTLGNAAGSIFTIRFGDGGYGHKFQALVGSDPSNIISSASWTKTQFYNTWRHVAVTRQGSTVYAFVDGLLIGTTTSSASLTSTNMLIGAWPTPGYTVEGLIDSFEFTNGTAKYTETFTPPAITAENAKDQILMHFDGTDGSATFVEENGHNVTRSGDVTISTAQSKFGGSSALFNGGRLDITENISEFWPSDKFTLEFFVRFANVSDFGIILGQIDSNSNSNAPFRMDIFGGQIQFVASSSQGSWNIFGGGNYVTSGLTTNTWYHFALTKNGNQWRFFKDGVLTWIAAANGTPYNSSDPFRIGSDVWGRPFYGNIEEFRYIQGEALYLSDFAPPTSPLSSYNQPIIVPEDGQDLLIHFEGTDGSATFVDERGHTITTPVGNATISTAQKKLGTSSGRLNGGRIEVIQQNREFWFTQNFTVEMFARFDSPSTFGIFFGQTETGEPWAPIRLAVGVRSGNIQLLSTTVPGSWNIIGDIDVATGIVANTWYHLALTRENGIWRFFLNGTQTWTTTNAGIPYYGTQPLRVGSAYNTNYTNCYIDELKITNGVALYNETKKPIVAYMKAYWRMDETSGTTISDLAGMYPCTINQQVGFTAGKFNNVIYNTSSAPRITGTSFVSGTTDVSWSFWIKTPTIGSTTRNIIQQRGATNDRQYVIQIGNSAGSYPGKLYVWDWQASGNAYGLQMGSTTRIDDNQWHHIVVTRAGLVGKIYIDGVLDATYNAPRTIDYNTACEFAMMYDRRDSTNYFSGQLDDFAVFQPKALSQEEVQYVYARGFEGKRLLP